MTPEDLTFKFQRDNEAVLETLARERRRQKLMDQPTLDLDMRKLRVLRQLADGEKDPRQLRDVGGWRQRRFLVWLAGGRRRVACYDLRVARALARYGLVYILYDGRHHWAELAEPYSEELDYDGVLAEVLRRRSQ